MANSEITMPIQKLTRDAVVNVRLTGMRRWNARMNCALWLIRLAAFVAPIHMEVETDNS